ncbi:MAG: hypothetical protein RR415_13015 [Ruthenibacterium sp.]
MKKTIKTYKAIVPIPYEVAIDNEIHLSVKDGAEGFDFPPLYGQKVGEDSEKFGHQSYIVADQKNANTAQLDVLIERGLLRSSTRTIMRKTDDGKFVDTVLTTYYLMYKDDSAACFKATPDESVSNSVNVGTDMTIELKFAVDGEFTRYFYINKETHGPFSINLMDVIFDIEGIIKEKTSKCESGFRVSKNGWDYYGIAMFDEFGHMDWIEFCSIGEIVDTIVSIRICEIQTKLDKN